MARLRSILLILVLALSLVPVAAQAAPPAQEAPARVRFVHASFDARSLDAYLNGILAVNDLRSVSEYMDVTPGEVTFSFRQQGADVDLATVTTTLEPEQRVSIVALGMVDALEAQAIVDDVSAPARNSTRVKAVNVAVDSEPVTITIGEQTLAEDLAFKQVSDAQVVFAGNYDVTATAADGTVLAKETGRAFGDNRAITFFLVGSASSSAYRFVIAESNVLEPDATSQFRFANMAQGIGSVSVYINKEPAPLYPEVAFGGVTNYFVTGFGTHLFEVYPVGEGPQTGAPLASASTEIEPNQSVLFVAQGTEDNVEVAAYIGDRSPLPPNSARLEVINLALGNPAIKIERMDDEAVLFDQIEPMAQATRIVPAGSYNLRFRNASTGAMMMEQSGMEAAAGSVVMLIAFDDDPSDDLINAVMVGTENVPQYAAIRWAHLNVWGPPVDIYMDDTLVAEGMVYKKVTDYELYEPKNYNLRVFDAGADPASAAPLFELSLELTGANFARTIYVYGPEDEARLQVAPDSFELLPGNLARVRFINAAVDMGVVDVVNPTDGSIVMNDLGPGQNSPNSNLPAGSYTFNFVGDVGNVASIQGLEVQAGTVYTIVLGGVYGFQPGLETFVIESTP